MPARKQLGERIRVARTAKGWKQKHLAASVSVEPITVSRWERGATTPDLDALGLVAEATGKPLSYFVDDGPRAESAAQGTGAVDRIEAAAAEMAEAADELRAVVAELRDELAALRARS